MIEAISAKVLSQFVAIPVASAVDAIEAVLTDQRAFNYAKELLRAEYERAVEPASYDGVVENFRISRQDLIDYFRSTTTPTKTELDRHLIERLTHRASNWTHNAAAPELLAKLLRSFYEAYEQYFLTVDPLLANLTVMSLATESRQILTDIQEQIARMAQRLPDARVASRLAEDVELILKVTGTPFDVIETADDYSDLRVIEPQTLVAVTHLVCVCTKTPQKSDIEKLYERAAATRNQTSHVFLVTRESLPAELIDYASRRNIQCITSDEFRAMLTRATVLPSLMVGRVAAESLARSLNVHRVYVSADAVPTRPGDEMEDEYYGKRVSVDSIIDGFLNDDATRLLVLLGDYGSGKSVVAAHTLARFSGDDPACSAAYVPLSQLERAELLVDATHRADNALRALAPHAKRRLVILDGLDELRDAMTPAGRKTNMLRLLDACNRTDKLIVTARTSYFRGLEDFWNLFSRERDEPTWGKLAKFIPEGSARPRVQAAVLREFDSDKILDYLIELGRVEGREPSFATEFLDGMRENDPDGVYQRLMRSPLYLFLIVNTIPWQDPGVRCLADIIGLFVRYWLERDISKGPSRWLLTTGDRKEFVSSLAWWMFQQRRMMITYDDFDQYVAEYFKVRRDSEEARMFGLDLHTTGVFGSLGPWLFFAMPAFAHYFVASRFYEGFEDDDWPARLPTTAEAKLWLGLLLTPEGRGEAFDFQWPREQSAQWIESMHIAGDEETTLEIDLLGIVYPANRNDRLAGFNRSGNSRLRIILQKALQGNESAMARLGHPERIYIANKLGLHARAVAKMVHALVAVFGSGPPDIWLTKGDECVDARSILGQLLLAAGRGSFVDLRFTEPDPEKTILFMKRVHGRPADDGSGIWICDFGEHWGADGRVTYPA